MGFVQSGLKDGVDISHLVSLGSLFPQPLMVYYRHRLTSGQSRPSERLLAAEAQLSGTNDSTEPGVRGSQT